MVVLDASRAEVLVTDVVGACPSGIAVSTQVMFPGGKTLAQQQTSTIGYRMQLRALCLAVSGERPIITEVPADGAASPAQAVGSAPVLVGVALRFYVKSGTPAEPTYHSVGVVGLLGLPPEQAINILTQALRDNGFHTASDLPAPKAKAGKQD